MKLKDWFTKGMSFDEYVDSMTVNKEGLVHIYHEVRIGDEALRVFKQGKGKNWRIIALTADWCGDAMLCVPIVKRLCEAAQFEVRFLIRDENLELMDQYLTNGTSRAIPIFIFTDEQGNEKAVWGPRSPEVQRLVEEFRASLPPKDDPAFEEKQKTMYAALRQTLTSDEKVWETVVRSVTDRVRPALG